MSGLFVWIVLSVWVLRSHKMVSFLLSVTFGGLCSHELLSCGRQQYGTSGCTDLIYHANLDILWVWDS